MYLLILVAVLRGTNCALCKSKEMVENGNFEKPKITQKVKIENSLPGGQGTWFSNPLENRFEVWQAGHDNAPTKGPQGDDMGQHLEINGNRKWGQITYIFDVPCLLGSDEATLSFDYWFRRNWTVNNFEAAVEQKGKLVKLAYRDQGNKWTTIARNLKVLACQYAAISFTSDAKGTGGVHIDNISFKVNVCQDIEMVTGGDFEQPMIEEGNKEVKSLPGGDGNWTTSEAAFMLKKQHVFMYMTRPQSSSQMVQKSQNQFLWINAFDTNAEVMYEFDVPYVIVYTVVGGLDCKLSFDYFLQAAQDVNYLKYSVKQFGQIISAGEVRKQNNVWENLFNQFSLTAQLPIQLIFTIDTFNDSPVYIDNVSFKVAQPGIDLAD